jgi:hypothetical protein
MGAWGIGLYASDFALDLRSSVKAVSRLPFTPDKLLDCLREAEPRAANDSTDADHTVFWLTVADQFAKRGIDCAAARERASAIIATGADLAAMAALGMDERSLAKRRAVLEDLRRRIEASVVASKARTVLKSPQKFLLQSGEILTYPTCKGEPINPYAVGKDWAFVKAWKQDGWGAFVVAERGLVFEYLAWYRPLVICEPFLEEPTRAEILAPRMWLLRNPGTLVARHLENMALKSLGRVSIDEGALTRIFPNRGSGKSCAVNDVSIANNISARPLGSHEAHRVARGHPPTPRIETLSEVAVVV